MLRAIEIGISISDLDLLDIGLVIDMFTEKMNDESADEYEENATQTDFDNF